MTALRRRLPGVRVEAPLPALREPLPRMDVALFVGFTAAGPLDLPVAVESLGEFEAVFGGEIALARVTGTGEWVGGLLHSCVRGFFSSGGRRCWIVRVAGTSAAITRFPLADLLVARRAERDAAWRFEPALVAARSPGSWADGLSVATRLSVMTVPARPAAEADAPPFGIDLMDAPALSMRVGDVLRITQDDGYRLHLRVAGLDGPGTEAGGRLRRRARVEGICGLVDVTGAASAAAVIALSVFEPTEPAAAQSAHRVAARASWVEGRVELRCRVPGDRLPGRGTVLQVHLADATSAWLQVAESVPIQTGDADGGVELELSGRFWTVDSEGWRGRLDAWRNAGVELLLQWLRLDLRSRDGRAPDFTLQNLAMAAPEETPSAGLGIATLPDDQRFFAGSTLVDADPRSHDDELTRRDTLGRLAGRFPLASLPVVGELALLPLGNEQEFGPGLGAVGIHAPALERDGLDDFSWRLFAEPLLADAGTETIADRAEALRFLDPVPRTLRGMHAAFGSVNAGVVDEPTLLAIPDAVQPGWRASSLLPGWRELPPPDGAAEPACECHFTDCAMTPLPAPRFVRGRDPDADGTFLLQWTQPEPSVIYELEEAGDAGFATASRAYSGSAPRFAVIGKRPGSQFYRVRARIGRRLSEWSPGVEVQVGVRGYETTAWRPDNLLAVHRLMLRTAAGRGDLLAVLGLPPHYRFDDAIAHASALRDPGGDAGVGEPRPINADEQRALSHGSLYHPWLLTRRIDTVVASPPDGAVCGQLAAGALERGAWVAVANQPLRDVVALTATASRDDRQTLLDAQVNLVRSCPHGFVLSTADTLAPDADWRPINVRRLMALLRRLALRRGATYVFETNGATLRRTIARSFEAVMDELFQRGAFAGVNPQAAYRVDVGDDINTVWRGDRGELRIDLKVAPSQPLAFLTVRLARSGERLVARETR